MNGNEARKSDHWAIALVHGIGNTDRQQMIQEVCQALKHARPGLALETGAEVHEVRERRDKDGIIVEPRDPDRRGRIATADVGYDPDGTNIRYNIIRNGRLDDGTFRIGTAHWADITYYRQGFLNLIGALMMTAFGVRFFAEVAATANPGSNVLIRASSWLQRRILNAIVKILALVVFPVTFVSLILSCMGLLGIYVFRTQLAGAQKEFIALATLLLCLLAAHAGYSRSREFRKERPLAIPLFSTIAGIAIVLCAAMLVGDRIGVAPGDAEKLFQWKWLAEAKPEPPYLQMPIAMRNGLVETAKWFSNDALADRFRLVDETAAYFALMHGVQLAAGTLLLLLTFFATINLCFLVPVALVTGDIFRTYVFATVSVITIWIINLILLWPENLATFAAMTQFLDTSQRETAIAITGVTWTDWKGWLTPSSWMSGKIETLQIPLQQPIAERPSFMKDRLYADTYPVMWFEALFLIFLTATALLVMLLPAGRVVWRLFCRRVDLAKFAPLPGETKPRWFSWPRLIVSGGYVTLVLILIVVVPGVLFALLLKAIGFAPILPPVEWVLARHHHDISVGAEYARIGVIAFLLCFLFLSHVIRDGAKLILDVVNHFTPRPRRGGFFGMGAAPIYFPVRRRIEHRFEEMIEALLARGDKPNLLIVAHSQGTVITLDALMRRRWIESLLSRVESLTVITFGSPVTHVYQRYFPQLYKPFAETSLLELSQDKRVKWLNVYRIDDFVGTYIENSIPNFPINVPALPGGHTDYWRADVMLELFKHPEMTDVLTAPAPASP